MKESSLSRKNLLQYGFIALPVSFAGFPLYILAPDFYATQRGLSLTLLGGLLLSLRMFDAILDPIIGWLVDQFRQQLKLVVASAAAVLCLSISGLFNIVFVTPAVWFVVCTFFAVSAYSVLTIALGAAATLWTSNKDDQTRIAGTREAFGLFGLITAVSLPALLSRTVTPDHAYLWYASILTLLMAAGVMSFGRILSDIQKNEDRQKMQPLSILSGMRTIPGESIRFFIVYGLSMLASSIPAILVIFYVRDLLGLHYLTGFFLFLYFISGAIGMPLWKKISLGYGKYKAWAFSNILAVAGFLGAFFLKTGDALPYATICIMSGLALGGDLTLPPSILADHIHARGNTAFSGMHYSFLAFLAKVSLALASALALPILDAAGFRPQTANSADALISLSLIYALIPCVLKLAATALLYVFFIRFQSGGTHETV